MTTNQFDCLIGKKIHLPESTRRATVKQINDFPVPGNGKTLYFQVVFENGKRAVYSESSMKLEVQFAK